VEFALVLPILAMLLLGIAEFGMIGYHRSTLDQAARAGVREAAIGRPLAAVREQVRASVTGMVIADDSIVVEYSGEDGWVAVGDAGDGSANDAPFGRIVRVRVVDWPHQLVTGSFFNWLPGVEDNQLTLNSQATLARE